MAVSGPFGKPANLVMAAALAAAAVLLAWPSLTGEPPALYHAAALLLTAVAFWSTHRLAEHVTALVLMLGAVLLNVAPPAMAFSGFSSGGTWLIFGGLVIGAAISDTGLDKRLADLVLGRIRPSYGGVIFGIIFLSFLLAFLMPATIPRILVVMPLALALADRMGFPKGSTGANGIALAVGAGSFFPSWSVLPANLPVVVHAGAIDAVYGNGPTYAEHFAYHFPVMGLLRAVLIGAVLYFLFRCEAEVPEREEGTSVPLDAKGRRLAALLLVTLGFWTTDFIHGIAPAWVGLTTAIVLLMPWTGFLPPDAFRTRISFGPVFYIAGILSIGAIMANSGLDKFFAANLVDIIQPEQGRDGFNYGAILGLGMVTSLAMTAPAAPAVTVPMAETLAQATGFPLTTVLMAELTGQSLILLPYAAPPLAVAVAVGGIGLRDAVKAVFAMSVAALVLLAPLQFLYWQWIGMFP